MTGNESCERLVDGRLERRVQDLRRLWGAYCTGQEDRNDNGDTLHDYGLCFDYVEPSTFRDQKEAFFRYLLSWGGPGDEFRFYVNPDFSYHRIEYWFLDWFDGAHRVLSGEEEALLSEIWEWFCETGAALATFKRAQDNRLN